MLMDYLGYTAGNLATLDAGTEAGLIARKMASANLTGGTAFVRPISNLRNDDPSLTSAGIFTPPTDDYAGIMAAGAAAEAAGGGIVQLKSMDYVLTGALPLRRNVVYRGINTNWRMDGEASTGGTRLIGNATLIGGVWTGGTFNCFEWNTVDRGTPYPTGLGLKNSELHGAGVLDLLIEKFAFGIKAGALNEGGCSAFKIDNVVTQFCSEWGMWLENMEAIQGGTITSMFNTKGQFGYFGSGAFDAANGWNYGDGEIKSIFVQGPRGQENIRSAGIRVRARGVRGDINDFKIGHIGINGLNTTYTATATMTNGSANIAVADLTKFGVDSCVYFQSSAGGFTLNWAYFVVAVSGASGAGTIQLAYKLGGIPITPNASATPTIVNHGYTLVEIGAYGTTTGAITYCTFPHIDAESNGTAGIVMQKCNGTIVRANSEVSNKGVVLRDNSYYNTLHNDNTQTGLDADDPSRKMTLTGYKPLPAKIARNMLSGLVYEDAYYGHTLYMAGLGGGGTALPDVFIGDNTFPTIAFGRAIKLKHFDYPASESIYPYNNANVITYSGAGGHAFTLPAITVDMLGLPVYISNFGAGTLTVNSSSAQAIVGAGASVTTLALATRTNGHFVAQRAGGTFFWARYA
jgi:hypothetical protein